VPDLTSIIQQLERQRTAIDNAIEALRGVSGESQPAVKRRGRPPKKVAKRSMSAEGRQRQIAAMRKYWAAKKAGGKKVAAKKAKKKGGLTAAGRKILSENMKRMWAEKKLGKKKKGK
jgi:hypothetical protein